MVKKLHKFISLLSVVVVLTITQQAIAQSQKFDNDKNADTGDIAIQVTPTDKNSLFDEQGKYIFEVKNTTGNNQEGKITYQVITETGKKLQTDSIHVKIGKKSLERYNFKIPEPANGFYKVDFMINVTDYDDTTRKVFGIRPEKLASGAKKPADFDSFWQKAKDDLAKVKPQFKVTPMPQLSNKYSNVFLVEMHSLENVVIHAWLTEPVTKNPKKKFAIILALPGYQIALPPILGQDPDLAFLTLNVRGQGNSRDAINARHDEFVIHHIEDKNKYVMRGVVMDCIRAMDFIYSRPEVRHDHIFVKGGSMGGFLAIATASLDKRVNLCSAQSPIFADVRSLVNEVTFPITSIKRYLQVVPGLSLDKILNNMDYFDAKNFAPNLNCKFIMSIGLLDTYVPPNNEYVVFNNVTARKRLMIYKDLGHEVSPKYIDFEFAWMHDEFGLYN